MFEFVTKNYRFFSSRGDASLEQKQLEKLESAIIYNRTEEVKALIDSNLNINQVSVFSRSLPLYTAILMQNLKIIDLLLRNNADPDLRTGTTPSMLPLTKTIVKENYAITVLLLLHRAKYDDPSVLSAHDAKKVDKNFIDFYEELTDLIKKSDLKLDSAQKLLNEKASTTAQEIYQSIAMNYELFLKKYSSEFEKDHKKFLQKWFQSGDCTNFAVEALEARIETYRKMARECAPKETENRQKSHEATRNRVFANPANKENHFFDNQQSIEYN